MSKNQPQEQHNKTPFISIVAIFAALVVFGLLALALQVSIWAFIGAILMLIALAFICVMLYRMFITAWKIRAEMLLNMQEENHRYDLAMKKLDYEHMPALSGPAQKQIERVWKPELEKWRRPAIDIVALTVDVLGEDSKWLVSHKKAADMKNEAVGSGSVFQSGLDFLTGNLLACVQIKNERQLGTTINDGLTASELLKVISPRRLT